MAIVANASSPATGTEAVFTLITQLCAGGWIIKRWSDATTLSSDNVNLTTNPYGSASSGAGNLGNTSAWFRIAAPDASREWLFQRSSAGETWTISRSKTGFTGGSPNATTVSTATDSSTLFSAAQAFPTSTWRMFFYYNSAASYGWGCYGITSGGGNVRHFLFDEPLQSGSTDPADTDPYVWWGYYDATGLSASSGTIITVSGTNLIKRFVGAGSNVSVMMLAYATYVQIANGAAQRASPPDSSGQQAGISPLSLAEPPLDIKVVKIGATGATTGWVGICSNLRWTTVVGRLNGYTLDAGSSVYYIYCAGIWMPWDSTTPALS